MEMSKPGKLPSFSSSTELSMYNTDHILAVFRHPAALTVGPKPLIESTAKETNSIQVPGKHMELDSNLLIFTFDSVLNGLPCSISKV